MTQHLHYRCQERNPDLLDVFTGARERPSSFRAQTPSTEAELKTASFASPMCDAAEQSSNQYALATYSLSIQLNVLISVSNREKTTLRAFTCFKITTDPGNKAALWFPPLC